MGNPNNISILKHEECCGCRACADICPKKCISFSEDNEGFFYPTVDEKVCISCKMCQKICPELHQRYFEKAREVIATYAKDDLIRQTGSSGGIFGLLADDMLSRGGKVWGAAFDEDLKLRHTYCTEKLTLAPLLKSKYLQSDTSDIYKQIQNDIIRGLPTLFVGTPCQCNALKNYIGENKLLYIVEIICHGVPSQKLFDRSIKWLEEKTGGKILKFNFRSKYPGALHPQCFSYEYIASGKLKQAHGLHYQFPFYFGFQKYITLRPSCYECKWACPQRTADITLGDFWGIEKYIPNLNAKEGVSMVILNSNKGKELFEKIISKDSVIQYSFPIEIAIDNNACLSHPTPLKQERSLLFTSLEEEDFKTTVKRFLTPKRKWIFDTYYGLPRGLRSIVRKLMDKRMKYE